MAVDAEYLVVLVTVATADIGVELGRQLVEERLAACVQVLGGGTAIYRWQGELYIDPQVQLVVKTTAPAWERLRQRIVELHADEVPEILALRMADGLPAYLSWLSESVSASAGL
jgi:periplasmic divalent cation tolerance protein